MALLIFKSFCANRFKITCNYCKRVNNKFSKSMILSLNLRAQNIYSHNPNKKYIRVKLSIYKSNSNNNNL